MIEYLKRWLNPKIGISFNLGFVTVNLEPEDSKEIPTDVQFSKAQPPTTQKTIDLTIQKSETDYLEESKKLKTQLVYKSPSQIIGKKPDFSKSKKWVDFRGKVNLRQGEILWIIRHYWNISHEIIYDLDINFSCLPFVTKIPGILVFESQKKSYSVIEALSPQKPIETHLIRDVFSGTKLDFLNPDQSVSLHCFCRIPTTGTMSKSFHFEPIMVNEPNLLMESINSYDSFQLKKMHFEIPNNISKPIEVPIRENQKKRVLAYIKRFHELYNINNLDTMYSWIQYGDQFEKLDIPSNADFMNKIANINKGWFIDDIKKMREELGNFNVTSKIDIKKFEQTSEHFTLPIAAGQYRHSIYDSNPATEEVTNSFIVAICASEFQSRIVTEEFVLHIDTYRRNKLSLKEYKLDGIKRKI